MDKALPAPTVPASQNYDQDYEEDFWEEVEKTTRTKMDFTYLDNSKSYTPRKAVNHGRGPKTPRVVDTPEKVGAETFYGKPGKTPPPAFNMEEEDSEEEATIPDVDDGEEFENDLNYPEDPGHDFTYLSTGTSYTPRGRKKGVFDPSTPASDRKVDGVGVDTFYGGDGFDDDDEMDFEVPTPLYPEVQDLPPGTPYKMKGALVGPSIGESGRASSPADLDGGSFYGTGPTSRSSKGRAVEKSRRSIATPEASSSPAGSTSTFSRGRADIPSKRSPNEMSRYITPEVAGTPSYPPRVPSARRRSELDPTPSLDRIVEASSSLGGVIDTFEERAAVRDSIVRGVTDSMSSNNQHRRRMLTPESVEDDDHHSEAQDVLTSLGGATGNAFNPVFEPSSLTTNTTLPPRLPPTPQQSFNEPHSARSASRFQSSPSDREVSNITTAPDPSNRTLLLETQWALERQSVSRRAAEVGAITIDSDSDAPSSPPRGISTPPSTSSPASQPPGDRTQLLEEQWAADRRAVIDRAQEIGAITIHGDESDVLIIPRAAVEDTADFNASLARHIVSDDSSQLLSSSPKQQSQFLPQHLLWKPAHYAHLQAVLKSSSTKERGEMEYAVQITKGHPALKGVELEELGVDSQGWLRLSGKEAAAVERFCDREKRKGTEWGRREVVRRVAGLKISELLREEKGK